MKKYLLPTFCLLIVFINNIVLANDDIKAKVNDFVITKQDIINYNKFLQASGELKNIGKQASLDKMQLSSLINNYLLEQEFEKLKITSTEKDIEQRKKQILQSIGKNINEQEWLRKNNLPKDFLYNITKFQLNLQKFINSFIKPRVVITDREVDDRLKLIVKLDSVKLKQLSFTNKQKLEKLMPELSKVNSCQSLVKVLKDNSIPTPSDMNLKSDDLSEEMLHFFSSLDVGRVSPPLTANDGSVQLFIICHKTQSKAPENMGPRIKEILFEQKIGAHLDNYIKELRKNVLIDY